MLGQLSKIFNTAKQQSWNINSKKYTYYNFADTNGELKCDDNDAF